MNGLPPNVNTMFWHRGNGKVKKPEAVEFEKLLWIRFIQSRPKEWKPNLIQVTIVLRSPRWLTKKGSITKIDADNRVKPLLDAIEKPLGIPDQVFVDTRVIKFPDSIESTEVYLRSVT
jgi:Holliday junction resolvase RusA-like endonuclease